MTQIYANGKIVAEEAAHISVTDRSYLFGEGLFESFRSVEGKIPLLTEHIKRLTWSATFLNISFPDDVNFQKICDDLLTANQLKNARFRIVLSQTESGAQNLTVFCRPLDGMKNTYKLKTIKNFVSDPLPLVVMKTTSYLTKILARAEAKEAGFDDGILANTRGHVTETTTGNIFWVDANGSLKTAAESGGLLRGVTKQEILRLLQGHKLNCHEASITPTELSNAREVFITNSVIGIQPVSVIDKRQIGDGDIGSITAMIRDLWNQKLKEM